MLLLASFARRSKVRIVVFARFSADAVAEADKLRAYNTGGNRLAVSIPADSAAASASAVGSAEWTATKELVALIRLRREGGRLSTVSAAVHT